MDSIFIEGLRVNGKHGVMKKERKVEQEFEIDIVMECDTAKAGKTDALANALDYAPVRSKIERIVKGRSFYLIERLGEAICKAVLADPRVRSVQLTIRKTAVWPNGVPGVRMTRTNS